MPDSKPKLSWCSALLTIAIVVGQVQRILCSTEIDARRNDATAGGNDLAQRPKQPGHPGRGPEQAEVIPEHRDGVE